MDGTVHRFPRATVTDCLTTFGVLQPIAPTMTGDKDERRGRPIIPVGPGVRAVIVGLTPGNSLSYMYNNEYVTVC